MPSFGADESGGLIKKHDPVWKAFEDRIWSNIKDPEKYPLSDEDIMIDRINVLFKGECRGCDLTKVDTRLLDRVISGSEDLSDANLSRLNLKELVAGNGYIKFKNANLSRINLSGSILPRSNFTGADLTGANLHDSYLPDSNFTKANLTGADLSDTLFGASNFSGANLSGVNFTDSILTGANLQGAILCNTIMPDGSVIYSGC